MGGGSAMIPTLFFYEPVLVALVWWFRLLYWLLPNDAAAGCQPSPPSQRPRRKRSREPKAFAGLTQKPPCAACEQDATHPRLPPPLPPDPMPPTTRRPRAIDTSIHFCPHMGCDYRGW